MSNEKQRVLTHAERLAVSLRELVSRLERAVKAEDLQTLFCTRRITNDDDSYAAQPGDDSVRDRR